MDEEIERVMQQTGMDRMQAHNHVKARHTLAARFGSGVTDSMGRHHRSITADAIRRGDWDSGSLMKEVKGNATT